MQLQSPPHQSLALFLVDDFRRGVEDLVKVAELALGAGGGDAIAESDAKAKVREDPLQVEKLLAEAQKGQLPMPVKAELATATATATFNIADKRDGLAKLAADAGAAKERAADDFDKRKHASREKALS